MDITYEMIAPNVAGTRVAGNRIEVEWKCAETNRPSGRSEAYLVPDQSVRNEVATAVKRGVMREIGHGIARAIGKLLGGAAGRVLTDASHLATSRVSQNMSVSAQYTEKSRRAAVVQAFLAVQSQFRWDANGSRFVVS